MGRTPGITTVERMKELIKPTCLRRGDVVAVVSPSWGGPGKFPHRYEAGKRQLEEEFGVVVIEMPHTLASPEWLRQHPEARAQDLMAAFACPDVKGIIASIGGDDSVRLLPYLNLETIAANPKVFLGYSDTTTLHLACYAAGLVSFYGPSIMAGFAENCGMHEFTRDSVARTIFSDNAPIALAPSPKWTCEHLDWAEPSNQDRMRRFTESSGWRRLNGRGQVHGHLLGGCVEVLEMCKGTSIWPTLDEWRGAILFLETSEEAPSVEYFRRWLRNYGSQGILKVISGVLLGRPGGGLTGSDLHRYDEVLVDVIVEELGLGDLPILGQLDFGHTDPMFVLPYGVTLSLDVDQMKLVLVESGTCKR